METNSSSLRKIYFRFVMRSWTPAILRFRQKKEALMFRSGWAALAAVIICVAPGVVLAQIKFATFNASLNRNNAGELVSDLSSPGGDPNATINNRIKQARTVAEIVQRMNPDVLLINEFDYVGSNQAADLFQNNFLSTPQDTLGTGSPAAVVNYPFRRAFASNTGIATGFDLNNNGVVVTTPGANGYGDDAFGFGAFPGQFAFSVYSKHPVEVGQIRTFQNFKWKDMPGNLLTNDPTPAGPNNLGTFYSDEEKAILRLSSKSHVDVPITIDGQTIHFLVSHPTPPVFDGAEDRNGKRNHDEIRFWKDYITPGSGTYIYDDNGNIGGLVPGSKFVIAGDMNADPNDGDSFANAIHQLIDSPLINTTLTPTSLGGPQQSLLQGGANTTHLSNPIFDTADFADTAPGNLRADYLLPSAGMPILDAGVFWPLNSDPYFPLVGTFNNPNLFAGFPSSDHRAVWIVIPEPGGFGLLAIAGLSLLGRRRWLR